WLHASNPGTLSTWYQVLGTRGIGFLRLGNEVGRDLRIMMSNQEYYLRPNVLLEPLVDRWYAWPHLIPPATAARNISERHLRIMESYINAPEAHAAAVKNRKLLGGPFMEFGSSKVQEVRALRDRTRSERAHLLRLSRAIAD